MVAIQAESKPMTGLTEGRMVHYVLANGEHRPAIVVRVWRNLAAPCDGYVNLQVFTDGSNDHSAESDADPGIMWRTSVCYDEDKPPHTWHWIEQA